MVSQQKQLPVSRGREPQQRPAPNAYAHNAPFIEYRGQNLTVDSFEARTVDPSMLKEMHMDLSSRTKIPPKLNDAALIELADHYVSQCDFDSVAVTYEQMLIQHLLPELLVRLKDQKTPEPEPEPKPQPASASKPKNVRALGTARHEDTASFHRIKR